ncbi:MAG: thiamine diphosphokinase [Epulopiscium sp.]|nr:thiamine diphosphokinase [Candidatus Epulonipiscium sp.]
MKTLIIVNGMIENYKFYFPWITEFDYIICADGGVTHARNFGIIPNIIIGDLDSASLKDIHFFKNQNVPIQVFPTQKDKTDTQLALEFAIEKGASHITIVGALGTRFDHTLANVHLLDISLQKKVPSVLVNEYNCIYMIQDSIHLTKKLGSIVSLIPFTSQVTGVCTEGLFYSLKNATLLSGNSYGISNEMTESEANISIDKGKLLVIQVHE